MRKSEVLQKLKRQYLQETKKTGPVTAAEVASYAVSRKWIPLPSPQDPYKLLAEEMSKAWREEIRTDKKTGRPYRANHAVIEHKPNGEGQYTLWGDIDVEGRPFMQKSFVQRREQIVGDCLQLSFDTDHWNGAHTKEAPISIPLDFTEDVEERKAALEEDEEAA